MGRGGLDHHPFFHAEAGEDLISACIRLSMIHKGGGLPLPWLLEQSPRVVCDLMRLTGDVLDEISDESA